MLKLLALYLGVFLCYVSLKGCEALEDEELEKAPASVSISSVIDTNTYPPQYAFVFPIVVEVVGVVVFFFLKRFQLPVPYASCMFILGAIMGIGVVSSNNVNQFSISLLQNIEMNSDVLLLIFLPGLIFRDAIEVNFDFFVVSLSQILLLAFPMVLVGTGLIAAVCVYTLPYNFSWSLGATLGAILSSTDPVAVSAVLKEAGAPPRLQMHISGESLLNDGSALVFYSIFSKIALSEVGLAEAIGWIEGIKIFFRMSLGGFAVGIAFALALVAILYELERRLDREYDVLQVVAAVSMAYLSYYVADQVLSMSGIVSCATCGIGSAWLGKSVINDADLMDSYLSLMEHMLNTLLFAIGGAEWGAITFGNTGWATAIWAKDWGYLVAFYIMVLLIRFIQVAMFYPVFSRIGLKSNVREALFLSYGGLRGAVGIALAVSLFRSLVESSNSAAGEEGIATMTVLVFLSGGVSLGTLLINGTTAGPMLRALGLVLPQIPRKRALEMFEKKLANYVNAEYNVLMHERRFKDAVEFETVQTHVPCLVDEPRLETGERWESQRQASRSRLTSGFLGLRRVNPETSFDHAVVETRLLFLEMLKECYTTAFVHGRLNESDEYILSVDAFRQSVDFAEAEVSHSCLNDWDYLQMFQPIRRSDAKNFLRRRIAQLVQRNSSVRDDPSTPKGQSESHEYDEHTKTQALRAICFIDSHAMARRKLESYFSFTFETTNSWGMLVTALDSVAEESMVQVRKAERFLKGISLQERRKIVSHYCATILLNVEAKFIEANTSDGVLRMNEARNYLKDIKTRRPHHTKHSVKK